MFSLLSHCKTTDVFAVASHTLLRSSKRQDGKTLPKTLSLAKHKHSCTHGISSLGVQVKRHRCAVDRSSNTASFMVCTPAWTPIAVSAIAGGPRLYLRRVPLSTRTFYKVPLSVKPCPASKAAPSIAVNSILQRPGGIAPSPHHLQSEALWGPIQHLHMGPVASVLGKIGRLASAIRWEDETCTLLGDMGLLMPDLHAMQGIHALIQASSLRGPAGRGESEGSLLELRQRNFWKQRARRCGCWLAWATQDPDTTRQGTM